MRRLAGVFAVLTLLGVVGAGHAAPDKRYLRVSAKATFFMELDYGTDTRAVYNGKYRKYTSLELHAIVVFDGRSVSLIPGTSMVISGGVIVEDGRTQWVSPTSRKKVVCKDTEFNTGGGSNIETVFTRRARVSVSSGGLSIDPGTAMKEPGCSATEELENHGLPGGPSFTVAAPAKSRFAGDKRFSISCTAKFKHPFTIETDGNGHAFDGLVQAAVRITPFPASKLADVKLELGNSIGESISGPGFTGTKKCLR